MRVLITGSTGFVGQHVVPQLLQQRHEVTAIVRNAAKARTFDWSAGVRIVKMDLNQPPDSLLDVCAQIDAVMHLAWPDLPNYQSQSHIEKTLPAAVHFLKLARDAGVPHLLVTGTCQEYGMQVGPLSEATPTAPTTPYARAKDRLRHSLEDMQQERHFTFQWARLFYMYGPGQNSNSLLAQVDQAIDNGDASFNMSGGNQLRDYLPVENVATRLVSLLALPQLNGPINICSGSPVSVRSLVEQHIAKRGAALTLNLGIYPYPEHEPMAFWGDGRKYSECCNGA
jgi:nucleoside-diphosphate-sugar epimerase